MQDQNEIKRHIRAIEQTRKITNAMHLISTARMKKVVAHIDYNRLYFNRVRAAVKDILSKSGDIQHPYLSELKNGNSAYIIIGGDKGMAGAYNNNLDNFAYQHINNTDETYVVSVGIMVDSFLKRKGIVPDVSISGISQDPSLYRARELTEYLLDVFDRQLVGEVNLIYTAFVSTSVQNPRMIRLLPLRMEDFADVENVGTAADIIYEPSPQEVFNSLVPQYVFGLVFGALVQAYASEQSARMIAMENATHNAEDMIKDLKMKFNIARQAAITQEISEIVAAADAVRR